MSLCTAANDAGGDDICCGGTTRPRGSRILTQSVHVNRRTVRGGPAAALGPAQTALAAGAAAAAAGAATTTTKTTAAAAAAGITEASIPEAEAAVK